MNYLSEAGTRVRESLQSIRILIFLIGIRKILFVYYASQLDFVQIGYMKQLAIHTSKVHTRYENAGEIRQGKYRVEQNHIGSLSKKEYLENRVSSPTFYNVRLLRRIFSLEPKIQATVRVFTLHIVSNFPPT